MTPVLSTDHDHGLLLEVCPGTDTAQWVHCVISEMTPAMLLGQVP